MKSLKNLFQLSLVVLVVAVLSGFQLNFDKEIVKSDLAIQNTEIGVPPDGEVVGVWQPGGRLAEIGVPPDGEVVGVWQPGGRLA
jgi:hypothetical protein